MTSSAVAQVTSTPRSGTANRTGNTASSVGNVIVPLPVAGRPDAAVPAVAALPRVGLHPARTNTSSIGAVGRASSVTSRKMPGSHHWSWSSRYEAADHWCTRTARSFDPGRSSSVTSNSVARRDPVDQPTSVPFSQTRKCDSTPSKRSSTRPAAANDAGSSNERRWSPVGFSSGGCGGSIGNGYCRFV